MFGKIITSDDRCECCGLPSSGAKSRLLQCSRCKFVHYCSKKCQRSDFGKHKLICQKVGEDAAIVASEEPKLRNFVREEGQPAEDLFETEVGHFGNIPQAHDYTYYRSGMGALLKHMADAILQHPTMSQWNTIKVHFQEYLRLCKNDDFNLRQSFPFVLVNCNLDDQAYAFARCFILDQDDCDRHHGTQEGDWVYAIEEGCRYEDILEQVPQSERRFIDVCWLVAILIVKLRLLAVFDKKRRNRVELTEEEASRVEQNRTVQVPKLMDAIHKRNKSMLPSLINPLPLLSQCLPPMHSTGGVDEAATVLHNAVGPFYRCAGALEVLVQRFGRNPSYDTNLNPHGIFKPEYFTGGL